MGERKGSRGWGAESWSLGGHAPAFNAEVAAQVRAIELCDVFFVVNWGLVSKVRLRYSIAARQAEGK